MPPSDDIEKLCRACQQQASAVTIANVRDFVAGLDRQVPLLDGRQRTYVNLDNAATTPPFTTVIGCLARLSQWYASVHRGSGFKSLLSTHLYEQCRRAVADFVGADLAHHAIIFVHNATHGLNKLAQRFCPNRDGVVLSTVMEHHSNMLPWRRLGCRVEYVAVRPDGQLDMDDLRRKVRRHAGRLGLVTVSAGSNVTGAVPPMRRIARLAHEAGALMAVDATQLVPRRLFRMGAPDDPERVDFAAFSAHKMYAPFGSGALVGPRRVFDEGEPDMVGGGTIQAVTMDRVHWAEPPEKDEAGTPNVTGVVALAAAVQTLAHVGMDQVAAHERALARRLVEGLCRLEGLTLYGAVPADGAQDRLAVVPFNVEGLSHAKLAAVLGYEWGIGVRNGCFCAQPYVRELLGVSREEMDGIVDRLAAGDHATVPGMVRASLGVYNTADEVDYLLEALRCIIADGPKGRYVQDARYMDYVPEQPAFSLDGYVPF